MVVFSRKAMELVDLDKNELEVNTNEHKISKIWFETSTQLVLREKKLQNI